MSLPRHKKQMQQILKGAIYRMTDYQTIYKILQEILTYAKERLREYKTGCYAQKMYTMWIMGLNEAMKIVLDASKEDDDRK